MGLFDKYAKGSTGLDLFDDATPLGSMGNLIANDALSMVSAHSSVTQLPFINGASSLLSGDLNGAVDSIGSALISKAIDNIGKSGGRGNLGPLFANLSSQDLKRIFEASFGINHCYKNLWLISIEDFNPASLLNSVGGIIGDMAGSSLANVVPSQISGAMSNIAHSAISGAVNKASHAISNTMGGGETSLFNLLATNISYTPISIEADSYTVGSAILDGVRSAQKAEISITFLDNQNGFIKGWFKRKASQVISTDGTVGVLADGLVKIRILHGFVTDDTNRGGFEETIICRPVGTEYELDRKDNALQEITVRFEQTDTFV